MTHIETKTTAAPTQEDATQSGSLRPRRHAARQIVERSQRLRNRVGVLIGLSLGLVALLSVPD